MAADRRGEAQTRRPKRRQQAAASWQQLLAHAKDVRYQHALQLTSPARTIIDLAIASR